MFKNIRKFFSEVNEQVKKQEEREALAKKEKGMIENLEKGINQYGLNPKDRQKSSVIFDQYMHTPSEQRKKYQNADFLLSSLELDIYGSCDKKRSSYKMKPYYLKRELNELISENISDEIFDRKLEIFSKKIEEKRSKISQLNNEQHEYIIIFSELSAELKEIFFKLYPLYENICFDSLRLNSGHGMYFDSKVKDIDLLNLQLRLIEIQEKIGVMPNNSKEKKEIVAAINLFSMEQNGSEEKQQCFDSSHSKASSSLCPDDFAFFSNEEFQDNYYSEYDDYVASFSDGEFQDNYCSEHVGNSGHQSSRNAIMQFSQHQKISKLIHFTNHKNLQSIMKNGILPITQLNETSNEHFINDEGRWDYCLDAISLSISHPNQLMFYKYRKTKPDENWVVLILDPKILWEKDCAFCWHNAADSRVSKIPIEERKSFSSFKRIFSDLSDVPTRLEQKLQTCYPTDVQAEVLVFERIDVNYIKEVAFDNNSLEKEFNQNFSFVKTVYNSPDRQFFGYRDYAIRSDLAPF